MLLQITQMRVNVLVFCFLCYSCELSTLTASSPPSPQHASSTAQRVTTPARSTAARPSGISRTSTPARPSVAAHLTYGSQNRFNPARPANTSYRSHPPNNGSRFAGNSNTRSTTPSTMYKGPTQLSAARPVNTVMRFPALSPVFHRNPVQQHALLLYSSRASSRQGLQFEQNNQHQQALAQYQAAVATLTSARASLGPGFQPRTDVPLAKSHLDVARELARTNNENAVKMEITSAKKILMAGIADNAIPQVWLWRTYYLLGDANFMERDVRSATFDYRQAAELNPCFLPAVAMSQYLDGTANPATTPADCTAQHTDQGFASNPSAAAQSQPSTPVTYQSTSATYNVPADPSGTSYQLSPSKGAPAPENSASTAPMGTQTQLLPQTQVKPETQVQSQPQTQAQIQTAASLSNSMSGLTTARKIQYGGAALSVIAATLAIAELGPWAAAISLVGMIVEDTSKSAAAAPNPPATR